jgi:UPF0755 protein
MMARHGGGGNDGGYGEGTWLPGGYAGQADDDPGGADGFDDPYQRGSGVTRTSQDYDSPTGPPWAEASPPWEQVQQPWDARGTLAGPDRPGPADLSQGHPSGPLPPVRPAAHEWPEPPVPGYPGPGQEPDYPAGGYPGYMGHDDAGYPGEDGYGYGGYPEPGYDDQPYVHPAYRDARFIGGDPGYADDGGYPAGDGGEYHGYGDATAGRTDRDDDRDYPDRGGWYGDVDDDQGWADEDDESDFLPGLTGGAGRAGTRQDDRRPARGGGRSGGRGGGKRKSRLRRIAQWLAISVILLLLLGVGGAYYYVDHFYLHPPDYSGAGAGWTRVRIYPGDTAAVVGQRLQQAGVVESARAFQNAAKASGQGSSLEPGYYRLHRHMAAALAFALLLKPSSRVQTKITIPEGQRLSQIIAELGQATGNLSGYQQAIKDVKALNLPSFAKGNPEGYLFPATYDIQPNTPPAKVLQAMVTRFGVEAASVSLPSAAAHAQLTEDQVIVVASLIQAEGRNPADFPKIAEVIYNRLNSGIKLQLDSTVMYALHTYGIRASSAQVQVRSPYNTYQHTGLPPGPIDSPGDVAIQAALHPAHGNLLYFVTVDPKTGLTKFTSSFTVAQQYQAELSANLAKGR